MVDKSVVDFVYCDVDEAVILGGEKSPNAIIVEKNIDPGQYRKFKKSYDFVLFKPDLSHKDVEKKIRHMVDHKLCDYVFGLEYNREHDSLHKKKTFFTAAVAKSMSENDVGVILSVDNKSDLQIANRRREIGRTAKKYRVNIRAASFAKKPERVLDSQTLHDWIDLLKS